VNTPKSMPFRKEANEGKKRIGMTFFKPNFDMENIRRKLIILPMSSCGCFKRNGTEKARIYTIPTCIFSLSNICFEFSF